MIQEDFLKEVKLQFQINIEMKNRLDTKANNMIAMAGTIAPIFMGFGIFLLTQIDLSQNILFASIGIGALLGEIVMTTLTIKTALNSYRLRSYYHPIIASQFFVQDSDQLRPELMQALSETTKEEYTEILIEEYLKSARSYQIQNRTQTVGINWAQFNFAITITMIPIFTACILLTKFPIIKPF